MLHIFSYPVGSGTIFPDPGGFWSVGSLIDAEADSRGHIAVEFPSGLWKNSLASRFTQSNLIFESEVRWVRPYPQRCPQTGADQTDGLYTDVSPAYDRRWPPGF